MRTTHHNYRDFRPRHILMMGWAFLVALVLSAIMLIPLIFISEIETIPDQGSSTTLGYIVSVVAGALWTYLVAVPVLLIGFMSTMDSITYVFKDVPALIWRNRRRFIHGVLKSIAVPVLLVATYWFMVQKVPIELPALGIWIWNAIIATRFALIDSYRAYRDDMTILDSFGLLVPQKMRKTHDDKKITKNPMWSFGDGVLFSPLIQAFLISVVTMWITFYYPESVISNQDWAWGYIFMQSIALMLYALSFKIIDAFKPWGEKGKLSIVRDGYGKALVREESSAKAEK